jgi:rhamnose utilization protein RhaD (predicted bifunctional aldolase and dehydrogenase)
MESNDTTNVAALPTENSEVTTQEPTQVTQEASAERLLQESKKFKERAFKAEKELESIKKAQLTQQGEYKRLYEEAQTKLEQMKKSVVREKVSSTLAAEAAKLGCVAPDAVLKLVNGELLQFDEDTATVYGADVALGEVKQKYPMLFQKQATAVINPSTPNGVDKEKKLTAADIAKLPQHQKLDMWKAAMAAKK